MVFVALAITGCGGGEQSSATGGAKSGDKREISFVTMQLRPTFDPYFEGLFAEFKKAHPDVEIRWLDYPFDGYETKLMTGFIGSTPPDVINIPSESLPTYADNGHVLALKDIVPPGTFDAYVDKLVYEGGALRGEVYALPWYSSTYMTFANGDLLKKAGLSTEAPPEFLDDLPELCRTIQQRTEQFGYFPLYTENGVLRKYLMEAGVPLLNTARTAATFDTPRGVEVLKFWTDLYRQNLVPSEALTATHRRPVELFKSGRLAIMNSGPEFLKQIKADAPEIYANAVVGPKMRWREGEELHIVELHTLTVGARSKHPELAAEFAAFITNATNQLELCKLATIVPSTKATLADPYFAAPDDTLEGRARAIAARQVLHGTVFIPPSDPRELYAAFEKAMEETALGKVEAAESLKATEKRWNELLSAK